MNLFYNSCRLKEYQFNQNVTLQFNFEKLVTSANGMLPASVYTAISEAAKNAKADVLEVGTAHGASAIAAAKELSEHLLITSRQKVCC